MFLMFHKLEGNSFYLTNGQRYKKNSLFQSVLQFLKKNRAKSASKMNCVGELASRNLSTFLSHALLMLKKIVRQVFGRHEYHIF